MVDNFLPAFDMNEQRAIDKKVDEQIAVALADVAARKHEMKPEIMEQGKIYELEIDMWATGNRFLPGHRIRVEISSSNFPRFDVNTNTGGNIAEETDGDMVQAVNRIYHTEKYPSHVILPLISIK